MTKRRANGTREVWVGMCTVEERDGSCALDGAAGAYVHVAAKASSSIDFVQRATADLRKLGLKLVAVEEPSSYSLAFAATIITGEPQYDELVKLAAAGDGSNFSPLFVWADDASHND